MHEGDEEPQALLQQLAALLGDHRGVPLPRRGGGLGQNAGRLRLRKHMEWYLGDGVYGDGPEFHFDYYNSYVIQPMLVDILDAVGDESGDWAAMREPVRRRAARYASILERLINRDGSYPVMADPPPTASAHSSRWLRRR
mgnify:CR=1 FL=1